jgi:hypothetical protein
MEERSGGLLQEAVSPVTAHRAQAKGQVRKARSERPDSGTAAEPALQNVVGDAVLDAPCLKVCGINRIG